MEKNKEGVEDRLTDLGMDKGLKRDREEEERERGLESSYNLAMQVSMLPGSGRWCAMPVSRLPGLSLFQDKNIIEFLEIIKSLFRRYQMVSSANKLEYLPDYCLSAISI